MNRCPTCGTNYPADARFCTRDGTRLLGATPPAAPAVSAPTPPASAPGPRHTAVPVRGDAPNAPITHANLAGKTLQGHYEIVKKVGEGEMSFVYLANDIATRERYAIKVLSAALSQDVNAMARLRREAALGMRLAHPNICHIIRLGETEDGLVYV
ncbi:MAG: protein kinase domain-containing protein, partial [bacterium]